MVHSFDFKDFIIRARVLKLYRQALRTARRAPPHARGKVFIFFYPALKQIILFVPFLFFGT